MVGSHEKVLEEQLNKQAADIPWTVKNQARMHRITLF